MLTSTPVLLLIGLVLGFLSGLGTGGGSLLVLWLTLIAGMPTETARIINLMFFVPSGILSTLIRWRQGGIPLKKIWLPALTGSAAAALAALIGSRIDTHLLKKLFGVLLLFTGVRELLYKKRTK